MSASIVDITLTVINDVQSINLAVVQEATQLTLTNVLSPTLELTITPNAAPVAVYSNSASGYLSSPAVVSGNYEHSFTHNLGYESILVLVYNTSGQQVFTDISIVNSNVVKVIAPKDLTGYRIVVQK